MASAEETLATSSLDSLPAWKQAVLNDIEGKFAAALKPAEPDDEVPTLSEAIEVVFDDLAVARQRRVIWTLLATALSRALKQSNRAAIDDPTLRGIWGRKRRCKHVVRDPPMASLPEPSQSSVVGPDEPSRTTMTAAANRSRDEKPGAAIRAMLEFAKQRKKLNGDNHD